MSKDDDFPATTIAAKTPTLEPLKGPFAHLKSDLPASLVVFLVALPLCLGIAVASGAPPLAGLFAGIVGGIIVPLISRSPLAVSGPAAGLTSIVAAAILELEFRGFLLAVVIAGGFQVILGLIRAGIVAYYFPSSVIKGMLAAIGIILMLKQLPHALAFDQDYEGDLTLHLFTNEGPISLITQAWEAVNWGAPIIAIAGLIVLIVWAKVPALKRLKWMPAPLVVVIIGVLFNEIFRSNFPSLLLEGDHLVRLPSGGFAGVFKSLQFPNFSLIGDKRVWQAGATIAAVASIETLLCVEAIDKLDPYKRTSPTNRELIAQGIGNAVAGLIGGIPVTAVIVRGSANINSGAKTRTSAFAHGVWLLVAIIALPFAMNRIPLAALAAVLLHVGYKLARLEIWTAMFRQRSDQWLPFVLTVVAIVATDLLRGVGIGMVIGVFYILKANFSSPYFLHTGDVVNRDEMIRVELSENVSFLNKAGVIHLLAGFKDGTKVLIDGTESRYIHPDVLEEIHEFATTCHSRGITAKLEGIPAAAPSLGH